MGLYLNPNADAFQMGLNTEIYVDKSLILSELNKLVGSQENLTVFHIKVLLVPWKVI